MDMAFLVPAYALAAALLWLRRPWGYVLGAVTVVACAFTRGDHIAAMVFQSRADVVGSVAFDPFAPVILGVYVVGGGLLLVNVRHDRHTVPAEGLG